MAFCSINFTFSVVFMYDIKFKHFLFPILPKLAPLMWLFSYCASCNLAVPFPVDCSVKFHPFSNNKHNNFQFLSAYWCILLIHLDSVHFENRLVINAWWQCFLWKIYRLSKLEIDFGVLFFRTWLTTTVIPWKWKQNRQILWRSSAVLKLAVSRRFSSKNRQCVIVALSV